MGWRWLQRCTAVPAIALFCVQVVLMHRAMLSHTNGEATYPVDDAFIHLSLAKHIAFGGVFGVTPGTFASASSSIVWPWLLAFVLRVFGNSATAPFVMNVVAGIGVSLAVDWAARAWSISAWRRALLGLLVVVLTPLPTLAQIGMEHTLHVLVLIVFVVSAAEHVAAESSLGGRRFGFLCACAAIAVSVRYESLFAVGITVGLFALRRRLREATALALAAALPVVGFGIFAKLHGSPFLPVSVLLKGRPIEIRSASDAVDMFGGDILHRLSQETHLLVVALAAAWLLWTIAKAHGVWQPRTIALGIAQGALLAHVELAGLGWFYRYDSYLVALLLTMAGIALASEAPVTTRASLRSAPFWFGAFALVLTTGVLLPRAIAAMTMTPSAGRNIFDQQIQTAHFLARYFPTDPVAINDIGAVTYYRDGPVVDLVGLSDLRIAAAKRFKLEEPMSRTDFATFTKDAPVAVLYDEWFKGLVPSSWFRVARWTIPNNVSCASASVSVYATRSSEIGRVADAARAYGAQLPREVRAEGLAAEPRTGLARGDVIAVSIDGEDELASAYSVDESGAISIGRFGDIRVRGQDTEGAARAIQDAVQRAVRTAKTVHVQVVHRHGARVCVTGAVYKASCVDDAGALGAVLQGASVLPQANLTEAYVWRAASDGLLHAEHVAEDAPLRDGDVIVLP